MGIEWIEEGLKKPGKTKSGLAKALGRSPSVVSAILTETRQLKLHDVDAISRYLEVTPPILPPPPAPELIVERVKVTGRVQAGNWLEPDEEYNQDEYVRFMHDPRFDKESLFALKITGNSINRRAPDGAYAICLKANDAPRQPRHGDWVVAQREELGKVETTIKQYRTDGDKPMLWPDSTDPRYQDPVALGRSNGETVSVHAFVLEFVTLGTSI